MLCPELSDAVGWEIPLEGGAPDFELIDHIAYKWVVFSILKHGFTRSTEPVAVFSYIIPNVLDYASQKCSIVVNDPKGEVCRSELSFQGQHTYP